MAGQYRIGGDDLDSIDLKALLISRGIKVAGRVYSGFSAKARISPDPLRCNTIFLPDGTIVQLTDLAFHMAYLQSMSAWNLLSQVKHFPQLNTPFGLDVSGDGSIFLTHRGQDVAFVTLPMYSAFYDQKTSSGLPFVGNAVLQGTEWLSFQCLWPCDYARSGMACQYCYSGGVFEFLSRKGRPLPPFPSPEDAAEMAEFAIVRERSAKGIQITGGSSFDLQAEYRTITAFLHAIDRKIGRENIPGEILVYATPSTNPAMVEQIFAAGADRVSMSIEIWDEKLARDIMPGKMAHIDRRRHLDCLEHVAATHGRGKACSNFIVGLEPAESCLEGADYLASRGVVPIASVWIPFGRPVRGSMKAPGLDYFRKIKMGLAQIYARYGIVPPGGTGLNVCMCRDVHLHRDALLCSSSPTRVEARA